jgi:anti-anti-sigma factor
LSWKEISAQWVLGSVWKLVCHCKPGGFALTRGLVAEDDSLEITVDDDEKHTFVRLHGRLVIDSSPNLRDRLLAMLQGQAPKNIIVDVTEVSYIDGSGIATLLEALKFARKRQVTLCLKGLKGGLVRLFEVTGLQAVFEAGCEDTSVALR